MLMLVWFIIWLLYLFVYYYFICFSGLKEQLLVCLGFQGRTRYRFDIFYDVLKGELEKKKYGAKQVYNCKEWVVHNLFVP